MSNQESPTSDEIDLGQLLKIIKKGSKSLGNIVLHIFLFLKKNLAILLGLILLGVGISYGLSQLISTKLKTEVIVRPNFESTDYLEDVVAEIETNIITKNDAFFKLLGVTAKDADGFEIALEAISDEEGESEEKIKNQMRYLEALNNFKDQGFAKIIEYINTNEYFNEVKKVYSMNAKSRIDNNNKLINQIDDVVANYSSSLRPSSGLLSNKTVYSEKEPLNVQALLNLKTKLISDIEEKNLELNQQSNIVSILNYGKTQQVRKPFFDDRTFKIPFVLVMGFLSYCFIRYLNTKSKELS